MRWLYLHFPRLLLDSWLSFYPDWQQRPLALFSTATTQQHLLQLNDCAQQQGLQVGMPVTTATALLPSLTLKAYCPTRQRRALLRAAGLLYQDSAQIALQGDSGLLLESASMWRLYQGLAGYHQQLQQRLQQHQLTTSISSGKSPLMAKLLAQSEQGAVSSDAAELWQRLLALPLSCSGLSEVQQQQLHSVGVQRIEQLLQLDRRDLGQRLGQDVANYVADLHGQRPTVQDYFRPPAEFYQRLDLLSEAASWTQLQFPLKRLLAELSAFLYQRQAATTVLQLQVYHRQQAPSRFSVRFVQPLWRAEDFLQLCQLQLNRQPLTAPALELSLAVQQLQDVQSQAVSLSRSDTAQRAPLAHTLSRLQARLGEQALWSPVAANDHQPEACALRGQAGALTCVNSAPLRPFWLLPQAIAIDIADYQVQWGPERIETHWWSAQPVQRDYVIALDAQQRQAWLYRQQQQWYLHGWFS